MVRKTNLAILGSTGSIGHQSLEVVAAHPELFNVLLLTANHQWQKLAEQALRFNPKYVVIGEKGYYTNLAEALAGTGIEVYAGGDSICQLVQLPDIDTAVVAIVGYAGLLPTIRAIEAGKRIALANKESLVVAGDVVTSLVARYNAVLLPLDSEHSAIFQCLAGELVVPQKLILTASGGPFRTYSQEQLERVTPAEAIAHPRWSMGAKISVDSATLMNKGFEVIEARWLFNIPYEHIEVLIHPESVIHSMVQFVDGAIKAQLGVPDMRLPIQYALTYPYRVVSPTPEYLFGMNEALTFDRPDTERFPALSLALAAGKMGGNAPCILNAANEEAVYAFLTGRISFLQIVGVVERTLELMDFISSPTLDDYIETNRLARELAAWLIGKLNYAPQA